VCVKNFQAQIKNIKPFMERIAYDSVVWQI